MERVHGRQTDAHPKIPKIAIQMFIDTYSRKVLALRCWALVQDKRLVGRIFVEDVVRQNRAIPFMTQSDPGVENACHPVVQIFMKRFVLGDEDLPASDCHAWSRSQINVKAKCWWSGWLKTAGRDWVGTVKQAAASRLFDEDNRVHRHLCWYLMVPTLQAFLDHHKQVHSVHSIRKQRNMTLPCGKPNEIFDAYSVAFRWRSAELWHSA